MSAEIAAAPAELPLYDLIADGLVEQGYSVLPAALPPGLAEALLLRVTSLGDEAFRRAGIGRERDFQLNRFVRSDEIRWLANADPSEAAYLQWMEHLRQALNRRLFMGLFDYEAHFARYLPGAFYKKHLDAFKGRSNRVLSTVFYLNSGWQEADGGQLLIYADDDTVVRKVSPLMATLVVFLSDSVPHEVLVAQRTRYSIAGWFRINNSINAQIDPPR